MAKVTITIEDIVGEEGEDRLSVEFDGDVEDEDSPAALMAHDILDFILTDAEGLPEREVDIDKH